MKKISQSNNGTLTTFTSSLICLGIIVLILLFYWQTRHFSYINYDDPEYVFANERVQQGLTLNNIKWAFTTTTFSNWHPITWLSHMLDVQLYGNNAGQHHFTNVIIHIINSLIVFLLFLKTTKIVLPAAFLSVLFALHPLHIQSVAWIAERKDLLSGLFFLVTLYNYQNFSSSGKPIHYLLAFLSFALGLMAKPMILTLPCILLLFDFWPLQRFSTICYTKNYIDSNNHAIAPVKFSKLLFEKLPFFLLTIFSAIITIYAQAAGGSVASLQQLPMAIRLENAIVSYFLYIHKTIWPYNFSIIYPYPKETHPNWLVIVSALLLCFITFSAMKTYRKFPYILMGWLWFLGMMVPVIGLIQVGLQSMADRYTYLPLIGLFIILSYGINEMPFRRKLIIPLTMLVIISFFSVRTRSELNYWQDGVKLFSRALEVTKDNFIAHNNLGYELAQLGQSDAAKSEFQRSLKIDPTFHIAHLNIGKYYADNNQLEMAIKHYTTAIKLQPNDADSYNTLGDLLLRIGKNKEAAGYYLQALKINPQLARAYNNLGAIVYDDGKIDQAEELFKKAILLNPGFDEAKSNLLKLEKARSSTH